MDGATSPRILYVDDNRDVTDSAVELLRISGFDALACYDGPHALAVADEFAPDICLLDLNMPGMNGDELAKRLHEQNRDRAILFFAITVQGDQEARRATHDAGFCIHLIKPVNPNNLFRIIESFWNTLQSTKGSTRS